VDEKKTETTGVNRRDFARIALTGTMAAGLILQGGKPAAADEEAAAPGGTAGKRKVIDWRCRPPLLPYKGLFDLRLSFIANRPNTLANPATHGKVPPVLKMVGKKGAMEAWWQEIDKAGVDIVVANGRYAAGIKQMSMDSNTLLELQKKYNGRFMGLAALNLDQSIKKTCEELEVALEKGLRGANIEPGYRSKNGGPTTIDNPDFYPIFEIMSDSGLPLMVQTGAFAGIENWRDANAMWRFDGLMKSFPKLNLVLAHGGYPSIQETLALALKHPSVCICPDCYMFWPGGQLYQMNIELLPDQFIYGSAFPFGNIDTTLEQTLALDLSDKTLDRYLYGNAARLLKLA
jgi:predicted TIM-barrel fold metal-dependent hydrolase